MIEWTFLKVLLCCEWIIGDVVPMLRSWAAEGLWPALTLTVALVIWYVLTRR